MGFYCKWPLKLNEPPQECCVTEAAVDVFLVDGLSL